MPRFHVIEGTPAPDTPTERVRQRIRAMAKPAGMLQCPRCGGRALTHETTGMIFRNGRPTGGTKQWICAECNRRGERVVIV